MTSLNAARTLPLAVAMTAAVSGASMGQRPSQPLSQPPAPRQVRPEELPTPAAPTSATRGIKDRAELEAFLDGMMAANLSDKHVAGATVAVVKDGQLLLAKGYGWSNPDKRIPVSGERSLFRIGSVSKLFTWTAVMQLVEQGKIDLDADVNRYLDFKIPETYAQPITMRHVMTHTPGFEEDGRDLIGDDSTKMVPLGAWLATHIPDVCAHRAHTPRTRTTRLRSPDTSSSASRGFRTTTTSTRRSWHRSA